VGLVSSLDVRTEDTSLGASDSNPDDCCSIWMGDEDCVASFKDSISELRSAIDTSIYINKKTSIMTHPHTSIKKDFGRM